MDSSSSTTTTTTPVRVQPKRTTSNLGTRRDKFLRSLGIPSFQHAINHKSTPYASTGVTLDRPPSEGLNSSSSTPPVPNSDRDKTRVVTTKSDKTKGDEDKVVEDLLASVDTDKRMSSIRLRNYKSIGNLDQQAREDGLTGSIRGPGGKQFEMAGGITVSKSMPLSVHNQIQNEEMEAFAGNLATIHVSPVTPALSSVLHGIDKHEMMVMLEVPGGQQTLVKTQQELANLHEGLVDWQRTNGHLRDLYIPELPRSVRGALPVSIERTGSSLSQISSASPESTTSRTTSNGTKKRQGSFLSNLQNKMRSTIRAVSEGSRSGATSPVSQLGSPHLLTPGPMSPALTPSNSLDQVTSLNLGLGKFDFEDKLSPITDRFSTLENRPSMDRGGSPEPKGLTLDSAAALVTAMTADERFAKMASRPSSIVVKSGGLYGKDASTGGLLPSPLLSPQEATKRSHESSRDIDSGVPPPNGTDSKSELDMKEISTYLNLLAQQTSVRASLPWIEFFGAPGLSAKPTGKKIGWNDEADEKLERETQRLDLNRLNSTQRKSMLRKSRSLGEGLLSLFAAGDRQELAPAVPTTLPSLDSLAAPVLPPISPVQGLRDSADLTRDIDREVIAMGTEDTEPRSPQPEAGSPILGEASDAEAVEIDEREAEAHAPSDAATIVPLELNVKADRIIESQPDQSMKRKRPGRKATSVDDFELIRVLGKGCAGKVVLVKHTKTGGLYAMKAIMKRHVLAHQELTHTLTEQSVLRRMSSTELSNPFIVKLWWSFHDVDNLYLVLDFLPGGDLATQLSRWGRLGRDRARFYTCEIVEGVEALHAAGIIYRDLKPENILLGADGHISLADFGLAAEFPESKGPLAAAPPWMTGSSQSTASSGLSTEPLNNGRDHAASFVGTAEYLAPEVIKGLPYSYEVDWWALGTMLYEALIGNTPFWVDNHAEMYMRVVNEELRFPEDRVLDKETKSFIRGLLQKDPIFRLCTPRIRKHPYLAMVDWDHVKHKRYIPPYIPPTDKSLEYDFQNFDSNFLEMDPALKVEGASTSGDSETDDTEKDGIIEADANAFDGYLYKHHDIVSVHEPDASELGGPHGESEQNTNEAATGDTEPSSPSNSDTSTEMEDPIPDTTVTPTPTVEAATAMLQRIQALTNEAAASNVKTSRHSREIMNRGSMDRLSVDRLSRTMASEDDDEWDIVEDNPDAVATNGRDTLFARGVVDKYRLAVLKRRESTVRRKPSVKFKRSSPSSSQVLGRAGDEVPPLPTTPGASGLKYRLRNRMKTPRSSSAQSPGVTPQPSMMKESGSGLTVGPTGGPQRQSLALRSESTQSVNSAWLTENGSDGAMSLDSRLTARIHPEAQGDVRRGSAGV